MYENLKIFEGPKNTVLVETRTKLEERERIPAAMVDYDLNRVQRPLWLQQSLIKWFLLVWLTFVTPYTRDLSLLRDFGIRLPKYRDITILRQPNCRTP